MCRQKAFWYIFPNFSFFSQGTSMMIRNMLSLAAILVAGPVVAEDAATPTFEWTGKPVEAEAAPLPALKELDPISDLQQPLWTTGQRFSFSNVYVLPPGAFQVGTSMLSDAGFSTKPHAETEAAQTVAGGFGNGWQASLSMLEVGTSDHFSDMDFGARGEVRKALGAWGEIWGNPALFASYAKREEGNDTLKGGVLLGGNLADKWSWAGNASILHDFDKSRRNALDLTGGVMYSVLDNELAVGVEGVINVSRVDSGKNATRNYTSKWLRRDIKIGDNLYSNSGYFGLGPSVSWRPVVFGRTLNVHGAVLLLNGFKGGDRVAQPNISAGVSYTF